MQAAALQEARAVPDAPGQDETPSGFLRRISGAAPDPLALKREALAEATKHRDYYNGLARQTRDMADERQTFQGREATMAAAMRYKAQALVWDREVCALTAQLAAPVAAAAVVLPAGAVAGQDEMAGVSA